MSDFTNTLIQITQSGMGIGSQELGINLISNYLKLINNEIIPPKFIALYNEGVKLVCEGSPVIEHFNILEKKGVKIIVCTTCLRYYNLFEKIEVGIACTMMDIISLQNVANKVINL